MPSTYEKIQSTTVTGSAATTIQFTSISQLYTDIVLVFAAKAATTNQPTLRLTFNGSGTGYSGRQMIGNAAAPTGNNNTSAAFISIARGPGIPSVIGETSLHLVHIMDYANTSKYKSILEQTNNNSDGQEIGVAVWANNAAINQITITTPTGPDFAVGSQMTLYGIKAA